MTAVFLCATTAQPATGAELELVASVKHKPGIGSLAVSPDGRLILTGGAADHTAVLWDANSGIELRRFVGHDDRVVAVAFTPDGRHVVTGASDSARLWDLTSGAELRVFSTAVAALAVSPVDNLLLTASNNETARLWDITTGAELRVFRDLHPEHVALAFSPDGRSVLIGSVDGDGSARLWDVATGEELRRLVGKPSLPHQFGPEREWPAESVAFSPDGRILMTGGRGGIIRLWETTTEAPPRRLLGHTAGIRAAEFSRDGRLLLTAGDDGTARIWDVASGMELQQLHHPGDFAALLETGGREPIAATFSPDGTIVYTGALEPSLRLWRADTGKELRRYAGLTENVITVAVSPDGRALLTGSDDGTAWLWDVGSGAEVHRLSGHLDRIASVSFSADGQKVLTGSWDGTARLWDAVTGAELQVFSGHTDSVTSAAFSPDGNRVLTGSWDSTARLWDMVSGAELQVFSGHSDGVTCVAFSPDGRSVLTGGLWDNVARLWDVASGEEYLVFAGHTGAVNAAAFSPDAKFVITGSADETARLWDLGTGEEVRRFSTGPATLQFGPPMHSINSVTFSADGRLVIAATQDGTTHMWNRDSGEEVKRFEDTGVYATVYARGEQLLLADRPNGSAILRNAITGAEVARLLSFDDGTWAVVDSAGRFDASDGGDVKGLHWVAGLEAIELSQLKDRYYEPGLLGKILGFNEEPLRDVEGLADVALYPDVKVGVPEEDPGKLEIDLRNRDGGLGRVTVLVNGKEIAADARGYDFDGNANEASISVELAGHPYIVPGAENQIEVKVYNAEGYLASRGETVTFRAAGEEIAEAPELWAVVAGISDYRGDALDLNLAAKDAAVFSRALESGAERLFGTGKVHITALTTDAESPNLQPTRDNLRSAMEALAKARPTDVVVVYLAGHGITHGGQDGDYYFLTQQATSFSLDDPAVRSAVALSSDELTELIKLTPANKQVFILDTCGAGRVVERITEARGVPSSQIRALDRMKDRTGLFILAGSAADAASYEASAYGQGLLTYSLLEGMRGASLRDDEYVDVSRWFDYAADRVPAIAANVGGIQRPLVAMPRGSGSFDVARLTETDRAAIDLKQPRPFMIRTAFQLQNAPLDPLGLTRLTNAALRDVSARGNETPWVFVDTPEFADGYQLAGRYSVDPTTNEAAVDIYLLRGNDVLGTQEVSGSSTEIESLVADIVSVAEAML